MLCILYVIGVGTLLGVAGLLVERALPTGAPRRWIWCVAIAGTMLVPPFYRASHHAVVGGPTVHSHGSGSQASWLERTADFNPLIVDVWQVMTVLLIAWVLFEICRVALLVRRARRGQREQIVDGVPVVMTDAIGPATVGVFRSRVLLPRWVAGLPPTERQYVVRHEDEHRRANDARMLFLASLPLIVMPWNLALWWQVRRLRLAVEMDCDRRVVRALGDHQAYAALLFKVAVAAQPGPRLQPAFLGAGMLERRLRALVVPPRMSMALRVALPVIAIALLIVVLLAPHPVLPTDVVVTAATSGGAR